MPSPHEYGRSPRPTPADDADPSGPRPGTAGEARPYRSESGYSYDPASYGGTVYRPAPAGAPAPDAQGPPRTPPGRGAGPGYGPPPGHGPALPHAPGGAPASGGPQAPAGPPPAGWGPRPGGPVQQQPSGYGRTPVPADTPVPGPRPAAAPPSRPEDRPSRGSADPERPVAHGSYGAGRPARSAPQDRPSVERRGAASSPGRPATDRPDVDDEDDDAYGGWGPHDRDGDDLGDHRGGDDRDRDDRDEDDLADDPDGDAVDRDDDRDRRSGGGAGAGPGRGRRGERSGGERSSGGGRTKRRKGSFWRELPLLIVVAVVLTFVIQTFVARIYVIPSQSMEQTLIGCTGCTNDRVAVDKVGYRFSDPSPGDVVVFAGPPAWRENDEVDAEQPSSNVLVRGFQDLGSLVGLGSSGEKDFVKRVIAVGGQTVACCDAAHRVTVDGQPLNESYLYFQPGTPATQEPFAPVQVPAGQLWVMGDNRNNSADSRYHGPIGVSDVIGKARLVVLPVSRWTTVPAIDPQAAPAALAPVEVTGPALGGVAMLVALPLAGRLPGRPRRRGPRE